MKCKCEDCNGAGVIEIDCYMCDGLGTYEEPEPDDPTLPPPSTAAKIRSIDELREWQAKERGL